MEEQNYKHIKSIIHSDFLDKPATTTINYVRPKEYIECPKCGDLAELDTGMVLTSIPPQYSWACPHCQAHGSINCDSAKIVDPAVWRRARARYAVYCKICGDEILVYDDEKPQVCSNCRRAVLAVRKLLEDKDD